MGETTTYRLVWTDRYGEHHDTSEYLTWDEAVDEWCDAVIEYDCVPEDRIYAEAYRRLWRGLVSDPILEPIPGAGDVEWDCEAHALIIDYGDLSARIEVE